MTADRASRPEAGREPAAVAVAADGAGHWRHHRIAFGRGGRSYSEVLAVCCARGQSACTRYDAAHRRLPDGETHLPAEYGDSLRWHERFLANGPY